MQCHEVVPLLSAYYDDELSPDRAAAVGSHVESCPRCAAELDSFYKMSVLTSQLYQPSPPPQVWQRIATQLDAEGSRTVPTAKPSRRLRRMTLLAVAAVIAVGAFWAGHALWHPIRITIWP